MKCKDARETNLPTFHFLACRTIIFQFLRKYFVNPFFFSIASFSFFVFQIVMNVKIPSTMIATRMLHVTTQLDHLSAFARKALEEMEQLVQVTKTK